MPKGPFRMRDLGSLDQHLTDAEAQGNYTGKVVGKFSPPDLHEVEEYNADNTLINATKGLFQYETVNGKPV